MATQTGTITRLIAAKYFGFIAGAGGQDFFFHADDVVGARAFEDLRVGDAVAFEMAESVRGPRAARVEAV